MIYYRRLTADQCKDRLRISELREDNYVLDEVDEYGCLVFKLDTEDDATVDQNTMTALEEEVEDLNDTITDLERENERLKEKTERVVDERRKALAICDYVNRIKWDLRQVLNGLDQIDLSDVIESEVP